SRRAPSPWRSAAAGFADPVAAFGDIGRVLRPAAGSPPPPRTARSAPARAAAEGTRAPHRSRTSSRSWGAPADPAERGRCRGGVGRAGRRLRAVHPGALAEIPGGAGFTRVRTVRVGYRVLPGRTAGGDGLPLRHGAGAAPVPGPAPDGESAARGGARGAHPARGAGRGPRALLHAADHRGTRLRARGTRGRGARRRAARAGSAAVRTVPPLRRPGPAA